ncbi:hypothetical protein L210DRAFT_3520721 [Boletus edulis BED1]|uniref:RING-type domain-containing protein n=1 Tax=Boletus edulis BED1 TaxID=1328754 RepID=A0AAD4C790_BOLED|nr:hypothetical protein L210DRAFT_3520721 [Boletus edulis BED1]
MQPIMDQRESGVEQPNTRIRSLEQENRSLRSELQQVQQNVCNGTGRSSGSRDRTFRHQIRLLERTITDLKSAREKDRRTIENLRDTEVQRDAKGLADDGDEAVPTQLTADLGESAKKLLRRMCDTIDMNTLAEGEECAVCMEEMAVEKCYSLPCRHPVCAECFERLGDGSNTVSNHQTESVQCPHCREVCPREECEIITNTAVQQWDLLLDISRQWAAMDIGEIGIGEEDEEEDSFMDDGSVSASESPHPPETPGEVADLDPDTASALPNDTGAVAYKSLPSPLKRKRLSELIAQRSAKQRV